MIPDPSPEGQDEEKAPNLSVDAHLDYLINRKPRVVCLCGSTRFIEQFATAMWVLERRGYIVLGCTLLPMWFCGVADHFGEATGTKEQCDRHHKRKIDLADEVLVLNIGGYIGESTRSEIEYATKRGKSIRYVEDDAELLVSILPKAPAPARAEETHAFEADSTDQFCARCGGRTFAPEHRQSARAAGVTDDHLENKLYAAELALAGSRQVVANLKAALVAVEQEMRQGGYWSPVMGRIFTAEKVLEWADTLAALHAQCPERTTS